MGSRVTALAWRPQTFDDVVGQEVITRTLCNAIQSNRIHHAYLFSGLRGSGKTSTARILAKALNCETGPTATPCLQCISCTEIRDGNALDVVEIDAASNNSVDNIRELREWVRYNSARDRYKIYIIDEVHMLSTSAFNALLKTLEEPPDNVVFILATTELHKIPSTILSRTQQFDFRQIPLFKIEDRLKTIAASESLKIEDEALTLIAQSSGGSMRDAISVFDQVVAASDDSISRLDVQSILGVVEDANLLDLLEGVLKSSSEQVLGRISELVHFGHDLKRVYDAFAAFVRDSLVLKSVADPSELVLRSYGHGDRHMEVLEACSVSDLVRILDVLLGQESLFRHAFEPRFAFELILLKLIEMRRLTPIEELVAQLNDWEPPEPKKKSK
ncbi:MAG: DNA polymerase III subunit gamma/tau [Acidobacteria bacterium]|nr:DNA polymerase III subunit gamma/tau [Acidobacteriota bacterium]